MVNPQPNPIWGGDPDKVAIILNRNAKRVGDKVRERVVATAPGADVFFTESLEQASTVTRRIVDAGYGTVITGGGDGTVANTIGEILRVADEQGAPRPRFGVLRLGTGNAVADFLGARHYAEDLQDMNTAATRELDLLLLDGQHRSTFAGFGWDAYILNNYDQMKQAAERFAVTRALFKSVAGWLIAGVGKSVPELVVRQPVWQVKVVNTGATAYRLDVHGNRIAEFAPGAVVYEGPTRLACVGTTPYYGFKFNVMPHADKTQGMFHLRLAYLHPVAVVPRLPKIWRGHFDHPGITDLQMTAARLEFDKDAPFQISGDARGHRRTLDVRCDTPVETLHFPH